MFNPFGQYHLAETPKMGVHYIQRHLRRIEVKAVIRGNLQHIQMNMRVLVPGESDVANLACLPGIEESFISSAFGEYAVGIVESDNLMVLYQIDVIGLQTP